MFIKGILGFLGLVEVLKRPAIRKVHVADLTRPQHLAVFTQNSWLTNDGLAYRALVRQPIRRINDGKAVALATRVVLHNDRAPPIDHRLFHIDRARRCRVNRALH